MMTVSLSFSPVGVGTHSIPSKVSTSTLSRVPPILHGYANAIPTLVYRPSKIRCLRFFPDVTTQGGAPPGHFYADPTKRVMGIHTETTTETTSDGLNDSYDSYVEETVVPVRTLMGWDSLKMSRESIFYEPFLGRWLGHASRAIKMEHQIPAEKLLPALRDVHASQLRFVVCWGALLVLELEVCPKHVH